MRTYNEMWDPIAAVDTAALFRDYLEANCSEPELLQWVMRHAERSNFSLTESARAMMSEAFSYLSQRELIDQVVLNEHDRLSVPGYKRWCMQELEAQRERAIREGAAY